MARDELYERYLTRAISEINELGTEIARAPRQQAPVIGSGHPLADIFLLKFMPSQAEIAEGVAFYGRVGQAVLKSVQRLGIDPLLLYGTNCVKGGPIEDDAAQFSWLERELAIVQPKIVVVMGEQALDVLRGLELPLSRPVEAVVGKVQSLTPTLDLLLVPPIEDSLDDAPSKKRFWDAFRALGEWWEALPPY